MPTAKPQQSTHLHPGNLAWMPSFGAFAQLRTRVPTRSPPGGLPSGTRIAAPIVWTVAMTPLLADRRMNSEGDPHSSQTRRCRSSRSGQSSPPLFLPRQFIGVFSRSLRPVLSVQSDDFVSIVTLTHHACDDHAHMIAGAPGAESVFLWTEMVKNVRRRGAGPIDAPIRTGPVFLRGPEPGDVLEVRILDVKPRGCRNPIFAGLAFRQQRRRVVVGLPKQRSAKIALARSLGSVFLVG